MTENPREKATGSGRIAWMRALGSVIAFIVVLAPIAVYFYSFFNGGLSRDPADWSSFGSYAAGTTGTLLAVASVVALIVTLLSTSAQNSRMYEMTLRALDKSDQQLELMKRQHGMGNFHHLLDELMASIEQPIRSRKSDLSQDEFLAEAYRRLSVAVWARMSNTNKDSQRGFDLMLPYGILSEMGVAFHAQKTKLWIFVKFIDDCESQELRQECLRLARSKLDEEMMFWLCGGIYPEMREVFVRRTDLLFLNERAARSIEAGIERAVAQAPPPEGPF